MKIKEKILIVSLLCSLTTLNNIYANTWKTTTTLSVEETRVINQFENDLAKIGIFTPEQNKMLVETSEQNRILIKEWRLPTDFIYEINSTEWINSKQDLNYLVNSWEKLETKTFKELTWLDYLKSPKDWSKVINALFDTSDIDTWLRYGKESRPLNDKKKQDYIADMEKVKTAWLTKIPSWQYEWKIIDKKNWLKEWTTFNTFINEALSLFKNAVDNTNFPSREILRRQFINSFTIAYVKAIPEEERYAIIENVSSQIAEYKLLTTPNTNAVTIQFWQLKYIFLNDSDLKNTKWLEFFADYKVFDKTLNKMSETYTLDTNLAKSKEDLNKSKEKLAKTTADAEAAKKDAEAAKKDAEAAKIELAYSTQRLDLCKKREVLWKEILENVKKYNSTKEMDYLFNAQIWVWEMRKLIQEWKNILNKTKDTELKQEINNWITAMNSYITKLDKKFLPKD